jgi:hypothetical protein
VSACEWCWSQAQRRAMLCGGSVADRYREILAEQDSMGALADCPDRRAAAEQDARGRAHYQDLALTLMGALDEEEAERKTKPKK